MKRGRAVKPETLLRLLKRFKTFCVLDGKRIPKHRHRRRAITCSGECQKRLTRLRKIERDHRLCSACGKPSTHEERRVFRAFRAFLAGSNRCPLCGSKMVRVEGPPPNKGKHWECKKCAKKGHGVAAIADIATEGRKKRGRA